MRALRGFAATAVLGISILAGPGLGEAAAQSVPELPTGVPGVPLVPGVPNPSDLPTNPPLPGIPVPTAVGNALSPAGWTACNTAATGSFLLVFAAGAGPGVIPVPVPPLPVGLPVTPMSAIQTVIGLANPAFAACGLLGAPMPTPECTTDAQTAAIPFV